MKFLLLINSIFAMIGAGVGSVMFLSSGQYSYSFALFLVFEAFLYGVGKAMIYEHK